MTRRRRRQRWPSSHVCCWHAAQGRSDSADQWTTSSSGVLEGVLCDLKIRSRGKGLGDVSEHVRLVGVCVCGSGQPPRLEMDGFLTH